jgi:signal transduction histidine kinase
MIIHCWRRLCLAIVAVILMSPTASTSAQTPQSATAYIESTAQEVASNPSAIANQAQTAIVRLRNDPTALGDGRLAAAHWVNARAQFGMGRVETATQALANVTRLSPTGREGDALRGYGSLLNGAIARSKGDFGVSLQHYRDAQRAFIRARDSRGQGLSLQALGVLFNDVGNGPEALRYLDLASDAYAGDALFQMSLTNNRGVALNNANRFVEADRTFRRAAAFADQLEMYAFAQQIRLNMAVVEVMQGQYSLAQSTLVQLGPIASLATPQMQRMARRVQALILLYRGDKASARRLIEEVLAGTDSETSDSSFRDDHFAAYQIFAATGEAARALVQLEAVRRIDTTDAEITASNRAALLAAQFRFDAQDQRILELRAEQLRRDVEAQRQLTLIISTAGGLVLALLLSLLLLTLRSRARERRDAQALAVTNSELVRALAAKAEFLASTSHEIRTPLNGILGMTQVMLADAKLPQPMRPQIELVHDAGTAMRALIDDILDVAKIEHGNFAVNLQPTMVDALVARVSRLFAAQAEGRGLTMDIDVATMPDPVMVDPDRLTQIVFNLVGNAMKFTHQGGVAIRLWRSNADGIDDPLGNELRLSVRDSGIGIAPEWHDSIFDMFRQVDNTRSRNYAGTGLGLSIVRQLVTAMGGTIGVDSSEGEGATFTVILPWVTATGIRTIDTSASTISNLSPSSTAVIVSDNPMRASMLVAIAARVGLRANAITSGEMVHYRAQPSPTIFLIDGADIGDVETLNAPAVFVTDTPVDDTSKGARSKDTGNNRVTYVAFVRNVIEQALQRAVDKNGNDSGVLSVTGRSADDAGPQGAVNAPRPSVRKKAAGTARS